jgi:hypothetical protein
MVGSLVEGGWSVAYSRGIAEKKSSQIKQLKGAVSD